MLTVITCLTPALGNALRNHSLTPFFPFIECYAILSLLLLLLLLLSPCENTQMRLLGMIVPSVTLPVIGLDVLAYIILAD